MEALERPLDLSHNHLDSNLNLNNLNRSRSKM
jgi:hypothetical protein